MPEGVQMAKVFSYQRFAMIEEMASRQFNSCLAMTLKLLEFIIIFAKWVGLFSNNFLQNHTEWSILLLRQVHTVLPHIVAAATTYSFWEVGVRQVFKGGNYSREEIIFFLTF